MIIPALICGMLLTSCEKTVQNEKGDMVLSEDIKSFNVTTGEIVFRGRKVDEIISYANLHSELPFFIGNKPVFVPSIALMHLNGDRFCGSPLPWASMNDLGLLISNSKSCILVEGYLPWHFLSDNENDRETILKQQEENSIKRKKELSVLIEHLRKAGKIVK